MSAAALWALPGAAEERPQCQIPIKNLWFLLLYAANLAEFLGRFDSEADGAADVADVVALLLAHLVEQRLRRNLSRVYVPQSGVLTRVRGRIDAEQTWTGQHFYRGKIFCRFDELSVDTPRNRLARAALEKIATAVEDDAIAHRCRSLARDLMRMGVSAGRPSRSEMSRDQIARHDGGDRQMVAASMVALDLILPSKAEGKNRLTQVARDKNLLPRIFQGAITGFYRHELDRGWQVFSEQHLSWPACDATQDLFNILPSMRADIVLENRASGRRLIIDTKFKNIVTNHLEIDRLRSPDIYQLYAYLRSQTGKGDTMADKAEGVLLYPAISSSVDEAVTIQGHRLRFATVDLSTERHEIRQRLRTLY